MNAERLHALVLGIQKDLQATGAVTALQQLRDSLQNQVNSPQEPSYQQQITATLRKLEAALPNAPSNLFPPTWRELLQEVGAADVLGTALLDHLTGIFQRNQITPTAALDEVKPLFIRLEQLQTAVQSLLAGFQSLNIASEELEPGDVELGILIPRDAVDNKLLEFGQELTKLNGTLAVFTEVAGDGRPGFELRTISSSGLSVFLHVSPAVGACIAVAIERVVALYKQLLEIRKLRSELEGQGVPASALLQVDEHANMHMQHGLDPVVEELIDRYWRGNEQHRRNELRTELRNALHAIANRIDAGYNLEVRTTPPTPEEGEASDAQGRDDFGAIQGASANMRFLRPQGRPILSLPEVADVNGGGAGTAGDDHSATARRRR
ncbi:MAG: hypothetical protein IPJ11_10895 [Gemmatimonadetes bacterium]|nr:hypothetical protein [Gemmatimonadota bacterium]